MKPSLYLLITALFLVSCDQQEVATTNRAAPVVVDGSRLVMRNEIAYEINSTTPFTGEVLTYHENGTLEVLWNSKGGEFDGIQETYFENGTLRIRANYKDGKLDGLREAYNEDGTLRIRTTYKDGEVLEICDESGCIDFN